MYNENNPDKTQPKGRIEVICGSLSSYSHRTMEGDKQVMSGETHEYQPLYGKCYL